MESLADIWWIGGLGIAAALIFRGVFGSVSSSLKNDNSLDDWVPSKVDENTVLEAHLQSSKEYFVTYLHNNLQLYSSFLPNIPSHEKVGYNKFVASYLIAVANYVIKHYSSHTVGVKNLDIMNTLHTATSEILSSREVEILCNVILYQLKLPANDYHSVLGEKVGKEDVVDSINHDDNRHNRFMNALIKYSMGDL